MIFFDNKKIVLNCENNGNYQTISLENSCFYMILYNLNAVLVMGSKKEAYHKNHSYFIKNN